MLFFQQKSVSFHFLSLALDPCHPFSRWASLACRPLSLFLRLSLALYFKFVDMTIYRLNLSKLNTLANTDTETIFAFLFRLYWLILLYLFFKTLVAMRFPAKITLSCIWVAIPVDWVILHWYACGADGRSLGRSLGRSVYGHVITKFSRMDRLLHFLTHGAPMAGSRARAPL